MALTLITSAIIILTSIGLFVIASKRHANNKRLQEWCKTKGEVISSNLEELVKQDFVSGKYIIPRVKYKYQANLTSYESEIFSNDPNYYELSNKENVKRLAEKYARGKEVDVFYNPENPETSVLVLNVPSFGVAMLIILGICLLIFGCSLLLLLNMQM